MSVLFDQLRISDDGKRMYINLHVNKAEYFSNIYLDSITIMTSDKVLETNPYMPTEDYIYRKTFVGNQKELDLVLSASDFNEHFPQSNLENNLFFVYIKVKGTPDPCTPCTLDDEITIGVTFDDKLLYQKVMGFTKQLADNCRIPVGYADFILLWNAFKASVETDHWIPAIKYYNMLFDMGDINTSSKSSGLKPCGCHG